MYKWSVRYLPILIKISIDLCNMSIYVKKFLTKVFGEMSSIVGTIDRVHIECLLIEMFKGLLPTENQIWTLPKPSTTKIALIKKCITIYVFIYCLSRIICGPSILNFLRRELMSCRSFQYQISDLGILNIKY